MWYPRSLKLNPLLNRKPMLDLTLYSLVMLMMNLMTSCLIWPQRKFVNRVTQKIRTILQHPSSLRIPWLSMSQKRAKLKMPGSGKRNWWERSLKKELSINSNQESPSKISKLVIPNQFPSPLLTTMIRMLSLQTNLRILVCIAPLLPSTQTRSRWILSRWKRRRPWHRVSSGLLGEIDFMHLIEIEWLICRISLRNQGWTMTNSIHLFSPILVWILQIRISTSRIMRTSKILPLRFLQLRLQLRSLQPLQLLLIKDKERARLWPKFQISIIRDLGLSWINSIKPILVVIINPSSKTNNNFKLTPELVLIIIYHLIRILIRAEDLLVRMVPTLQMPVKVTLMSTTLIRRLVPEWHAWAEVSLLNPGRRTTCRALTRPPILVNRPTIIPILLLAITTVISLDRIIWLRMELSNRPLFQIWTTSVILLIQLIQTSIKVVPICPIIY